MVNEEIIRMTGANHGSVFRTERRTKTPGKIRRALHELETIESAGKDLPAAEFRDRLSYAEWLLQEAGNDLAAEDRKVLDRSLRTGKSRDIPAVDYPRSYSP
jgi:hypothetical protein